jgi:hypothetical protein
LQVQQERLPIDVFRLQSVCVNLTEGERPTTEANGGVDNNLHCESPVVDCTLNGYPYIPAIQVRREVGDRSFNRPFLALTNS